MKTDEILKQLGTKIRSLREEQKITQQELAYRCDFETSNMSRIEVGKSNFTVGTLNKIAVALNIPIKDLF